jgi:hypothetical protein
MSGLSVGPRCRGAPGGLASSNSVSSQVIGKGEPRPPVLKRGQAMRQRHQVPTWQCTTVPHPVFRCVSHDLVPTATNVAPARCGITVSRAGPQGMMLAQHARLAPDRMHLVRQVPASWNSSGGSR